MNRHKRNWGQRTGAGAAALILAVALSGCSRDMIEGIIPPEEELPREEMQISAEANKRLEDNMLLYAGDDDTSIVTMYLTVSEGNESEGTNHTWEEVNSYSVYHYEELGIDRYKVNGLLQVGDENGPAEGELGYGMHVPNAIVNIRGQTSSGYSQKSYKIELKDGKGKWKDQKVINLNKHQQEGLRFRNKLMYDLIEEMPGMIALQTQFVHLYVKDETEGGSGEFEDYGLYTQVEQPNKSFLQRHGLDKNGHLYKINFFEFYCYDEIRLKSDAAYDLDAFEYRIEIKGNDDHRKLIAMLQDVNDETIPIEDVIDKWFERDNLCSWLAFQILTGNLDTQNRNTLLYSPLNFNTWYFISWDCDGALMETEWAVREREEEPGWEHGISNYWGNVLFRRMFTNESMRRELDQKIEEYRALLSEDKLAKMAESYAAVVKDYAYGPIDGFYEPLTQEQYDEVCRAIPSEIEANYRKYKESLEEPMPFYIGVPVSNGNSCDFVWDSSYDFNAETIRYTFDLADNLKFENPIVHEEDLLIPEYSYQGVLEPGQYFVRVKARNESGRSQYAFDYYVAEGARDSYKVYGTKCFYVLEDGTVAEDVYVE